uniref:Uncharacterized protein n=1 Tax=Arion vulgaris TaxID=1028688 RepID=A0A0B6YSG5_9EUPU
MCTPVEKTWCNCNDCLSEYRETGCAVERMKEQDWCRKQRAHLVRYQEEMASDIFGLSDPQLEISERCNFVPDKQWRSEQRHFPKIHNKSQLNL